MQAEIDAQRQESDLPIAILGINEAGQEGGNDGMCQGRVLPWLQDTREVDVWRRRWNPIYRDVVMLDEENRFAGSFNLTEHNLADSTNYARLKAKLVELSRP
jgi:hypothetical protein